MRFLIQKIDNKVVHEFSFTLLESIRYQKWLEGEDADVIVKYVNCLSSNKVWFFSPFHEHYVPVGSVEFVLSWMKRFDVPTPSPMNVPEELFEPFLAMRPIMNGTHKDIKSLVKGKWFVKSNDKFKGFAEVLRIKSNIDWNIPKGNYQMSEYMRIDSEWRAFVYKGKMVGLQNYGGDFTVFPNKAKIQKLIHYYKSAPVAYTLDVGVNDHNTFIIEVHDFFSCGLYGFADHKIYPYMLYRWFHEYLNKNK